MKRIATVITIFASMAFLLGPFPAAHAGTLPNISGTWYMGGNHSKRCHISQSGNSITLRNERGENATGSFVDPSHITTKWPESAYTPMGPKLQIDGRISGNLSTILWSNSTYWTRSAEGAHALPDISGTWFMGGDPSKRCHIRQRGSALTLTNETGQTATGSFVNQRRITTNWSGRQVEGHLSSDFQRIDWNNSTRWTRGSY
ncbi:MAG TPA: hypothetical protein VFO29_00115 [Candidatus Rubrimentiphilum sp.]|nr:hypothetical protein [Candidatus Rubrimentiphilum sp.]